MVKKLARTGNSLALILDKPLLERLGIDENTPLEISTDDETIIISPVRDKKRKARLRELMAEAHEQYGEVFKRLAE